MDNEEETSELTAKDVVVISGGILLVTASLGVIAHIGWDAYGEAKRSLQARKARKQQETV